MWYYIYDLYYIFSATPGTSDSSPTVKERLHQLQLSYSGNFSIHGLTRILHGDVKDRVIWFLLFLTALIAAGYMNRNAIRQYAERHIRTEILIERREEQHWPTIAFCPGPIITHDIFCSKNLSLIGSSYTKQCSNDPPLPYVIKITTDSKTLPLQKDKNNQCSLCNLKGTEKCRAGSKKYKNFLKFKKFNSRNA